MPRPPVTVVVVTARRRLARAAAACRTSLAHLGPDDRAVLVCMDDRFGELLDHPCLTLGDERFTVHGPRWVDEVLGDLHHLALLLPIDGLVRAIRPRLVAHLLGLHPERTVVSVPAESIVRGPLDVLVDAATSGLALVRTRHTPVPDDGRMPDSVAVAERGVVEQDLFAATTGAASLLQELAAALTPSRHHAGDRIDAARHLALDALVGRDGAVLVKQTIALSWADGDEPGAHEAPVVLLPGFDPRRPWVLSADTGAFPRVLLSEHPRLASALGTHAARLVDDGDTLLMERSDGWTTLDDGTRLDAAMRHAARMALTDPDAAMPDPFATGGGARFVEWLCRPTSPRSTLSRYLRALHAVRDDLRARFPDPDAEPGLRAWAHLDGRDDGLDPRLLPPVEDVRFDDADDRRDDEPALLGINVIGLLRGELGVGEAARLALRAVERSGVPHAVVVDDATVHRQEHPFLDEGHAIGAPVYAVDLLAVNADGFADALRRTGRARRPGRHVIGLWFWEVEVFPSRFADALALVDEVWVATEHVRAAIASTTDVPVHLLPLGAPTTPDGLDDAAATVSRTLGIADDRWVVSFCFDLDSVTERKNPWDVIHAYTRAFPSPGVAVADGRVPLLVLKAISGEFHPLERERLLLAAVARPDIVVVDRYLSALETAGLLARTDCYVSLHRAEGWGLTLLEAMRAGTPVVATGYSGNVDFMTADNTIAVPCELVPIPDDTPVYAGCGRWAQPDVDAAAHAIRSLADDPSLAARIGAQAAADARTLAQSDAGAAMIRERLRLIGEQLTAARTPRTSVDVMPTPEVPVADAPAAPHDPLEERTGLGPVILPPRPPAPEAPDGLRGNVQRRVENAIRFEIERRDLADHERAAAIVEAITETRRAVQVVRDAITVGRADQQTLTRVLEGAVEHLTALQAGHDALHGAVTDLGRTAHGTDVRVHDLQHQVDRLQEQLGELTAAMERVARRLEP